MSVTFPISRNVKLTARRIRSVSIGAGGGAFNGNPFDVGMVSSKFVLRDQAYFNRRGNILFCWGHNCLGLVLAFV